jgi:hypothetical protein
MLEHRGAPVETNYCPRYAVPAAVLDSRTGAGRYSGIGEQKELVNILASIGHCAGMSYRINSFVSQKPLWRAVVDVSLSASR